eukprot:scaffold73084_cov51-Phaeocystis_antarctica.AAC.1
MKGLSRPRLARVSSRTRPAWDPACSSRTLTLTLTLSLRHPVGARLEELLLARLRVVRWWKGRLWRRLARAPEAVAGCPVARPLPGSAELPRCRQARPEEAQEPSWGAAKGAL